MPLRIRSIATLVSEGEMFIKKHRIESKKQFILSVRILSFSAPHFSAFGSNSER